MPKKLAVMANALANDDTVASDEIAAAIDYMDMKIKDAEVRGAPLPFVAFRTRTLLETALKLRRDAGLSL